MLRPNLVCFCRVMSWMRVSRLCIPGIYAKVCLAIGLARPFDNECKWPISGENMCPMIPEYAFKCTISTHAIRDTLLSCYMYIMKPRNSAGKTLCFNIFDAHVWIFYHLIFCYDRLSDKGQTIKFQSRMFTLTTLSGFSFLHKTNNWIIPRAFCYDE